MCLYQLYVDYFNNSTSSWQLSEDASDAVLEIEQKYSKLRRPVYERRSQILKGMPDFWSKTMRHALNANCTDDDIDVLGHLIDVR